MFHFDSLVLLRSATHQALPILCIAIFVALAGSFAWIPTTFAATHHQQQISVKPGAVTLQCLSEVAYISEVGDNAADGFGESINDCPATVSVSQIINVTSSCPGLGSGSGTINTGGSVVPNNSFTQSFGANAGCVVCHYTNHLLSGETYPNFTLLATVTASGSFTYKSVAYHATSNTGSSSVIITNTGRYAPTCPLTD